MDLEPQPLHNFIIIGLISRLIIRLIVLFSLVISCVNSLIINLVLHFRCNHRRFLPGVLATKRLCFRDLTAANAAAVVAVGRGEAGGMGGIAAVVVIVGRQRVMVLWLMLLQEVGRGAEGGRRSAELRRGTGELHCPTVQR